jgi:nitrous-oxide reductase
MTAIRSHFTPDIVRAKEGDTIHLHLTSLEQAHDATHGSPSAPIQHQHLARARRAQQRDVQGPEGRVYPLYCTEFCSALHLEMAGYLLVEPKG